MLELEDTSQRLLRAGSGARIFSVPPIRVASEIRPTQELKGVVGGREEKEWRGRARQTLSTCWLIGWWGPCDPT